MCLASLNSERVTLDLNQLRSRNVFYAMNDGENLTLQSSSKIIEKKKASG